MSELTFLLLINICGAVLLTLVFYYLYYYYREKYMLIWSFSWLLFSVRLNLDLLRINGYENVFFLLLNQITSIGSVLLLLWGMNHFVNKEKFNKYWIYAALFATIITDIAIIFEIPIYISAIPTAAFFGITQIWTGVSFLKIDNIKGLGKTITGYSFLLTGLLNIFYTKVPSKLFFSISSFLWIFILLGVLVVYFQKIRMELMESEERYRLLADNAKDIIYRLHFKEKHFVIDYVSPSVKTIIDYEPEEFYQNPSLIHEILQSDSESLLEILSSQILYERPSEMLLLSKNGQQIWTENQIVPFFQRNGQIRAIEGIIRDISERKRVEQEMARLNQLHILGETAATIAHEIRNPLTSVHGFLQLLGDKFEKGPYKEWFAIMRQELERANHIITDYLTFTKRDQKDFIWINLNEIITTLIPLIESKALLNSMQVKLELEEIPHLHLDEKEIRQLILNLAQNGLEAMKPGGTLYIKTQKIEDKIHMLVKDEGPGIERNVLEKLGTPFFTTKEGGTGLGLAVCYQIADRNQARIQVDTSTNGTSFTVQFKN